MHTLPTDISIAVIGMGYVGLPLALAFSKHQAVVGFDINRDRVKELNAGKDSTKEADPKELQEALNGNLSLQTSKTWQRPMFTSSRYQPPSMTSRPLTLVP
jgi:UDP-N-acetyl-D-mannosaminuronate dehydrogenase